MDLLFYHGDETEKRLVAVAYRAAESILRSFKYLLPSIGSELWALLSVDTLWGLALLAAGWFLTSVISDSARFARNFRCMRGERSGEFGSCGAGSLESISRES